MFKILLLSPTLIVVLLQNADLIAEEDTNMISIEENINIEGNTLESLLNTKIETASKYSQKAGEAPASVTIITSEDIERYNYANLVDVLNSIRSIAIRNDLNYKYVGVRGSDRPSSYGSNISLLLNGHIFNENIYDGAFYGDELGIDLRSIERIEVIRGAGSALYGTGAMLCVINIITKDAKAIDGLILSGQYGSFGTLTGSLIYGKELGDNTSLMIQGRIGKSDGTNHYFSEYDFDSTNYGIAENLDWERFHGIFADIRYNDFRLYGFYSARRKAVPTGAWEMIFNKQGAETYDERSFIETKYESDVDADKNIMARVYLDLYKYIGKYPGYKNNTNINYYDRNDGRWVGAEVQFTWDILANNRLIAGTEYKRHMKAYYRYWDEEEIYFDNNFPFSIYSFYFQDSYQLSSNLSFVGGLRYDFYTSTKNSLTPRLAAVYDPIEDLTIKLLYGNGFRAPNIYECYYEDPGIAKSNPNLNSEKVNTLESVFEYKISDILFSSASFYRYWLTNLIELVVADDGLNQFQNINNAAAYGFELELILRTKFGLWGYMSYSYQSLKNLDSEKMLSNLPENSFKSGLSVRLYEHLLLSFENLYESSRITVYNTITNPYLISSLSIKYEPSKNSHIPEVFDYVSIGMKINNLFNRKYSLPGGLEHIQNSIEQYGRSLLFELSIEY